MNIFITGLAGFLGSSLGHRLLDMGHNVSGNDNFIGGYEDNLNAKFKFNKGDCKDFNFMRKALDNIDTVIHCAATAYEGFSVFSPSFITKNIFESSVSTFSASINNNVKKIIFCSSMARYGGQDYPFTEDMIVQPEDPYGIAKVAAENILKNLSKIHNFDYTILVPHNIVGPRQKYDDPYRNVLSIFLNRNLRNKPAIIYGDGNQKRCFSYIDDCVDCIIKTIELEETNSEIINIGPDEEFITIKELADKCSNITGYNKDPIYLKARPAEVKFATCSSNKARKLLNYKTNYTLDKAIEKTLQYIKTRGPRDFDYSLELEIKNHLTPKTWLEKLL